MFVLCLHPTNLSYVRLKIPDLSKDVEKIIEKRKLKINELEEINKIKEEENSNNNLIASNYKISKKYKPHTKK